MDDLGMTREARARLEAVLRRARHAQNTVRSRAHLEHADAYLEHVVREISSLIKDAAIVDPLPPRNKRRKPE